MACTSINGAISIGCLGNLGGATAIYIANFADVLTTAETGAGFSGYSGYSGYTGSIDNLGTDGAIDTITMTASTKFYAIEIRSNTSDYKETFVNNLESGAQFYQQVVTIKLPRREANKRNKIALLAAGKFVMIIKDANGLYWLLGEENGMYLSKNEGGSGTKTEDGSGYLLELTAIGEPAMAKEVAPAAVAANI